MNITAKIIQDSISEHTNQRICTFELEYPRFIHGEVMTHRLFSRNAASSRAIPINRMIELVENNPAMPVHWGKNQAGMQAKEELNKDEQKTAKLIWLNARDNAVASAEHLSNLGTHKQITNRILEPFQMIKVLVTSTSFDNFFNLRCHEDAQPEIHTLADEMYKSFISSTPTELKAGEWHLPYIERVRTPEGTLQYFTYEDGIANQLNIDDAIKISCSCAAQVSYRKNDTSIEKALRIFDKLVQADPVHASAFEHCASPIEYNVQKGIMLMNNPVNWSSWEEGITHMDKKTNLCSGNFINWIQYRQLISNNACWNYE